MKALDVLRVVGHTDWGGDRTVLLRLYRALVRSKLDYGLDLTTFRKAETPDPIYFHGLQQILADFPGFRRIFTDGSKSEDGRVGAAAVMDGLQQILADFPGFRRIFTDGSKSEDGRVGAAAVMDEGKKAARLHPFLVGETLRSCTGRPDASRLRSGDLLVECKRKAHSNSLLQLQKIGDYPVTVSPHRSLNSSRGVIRDEALADLGEAELIRALKSQAVTHAKVFKTGTIILTFGQPTAPEKLWAGFYWVKVKAFIPLPLRCFKCQSDHFPVILSTASSEEDATVGRWNLKKANWDLFSASCRSRLAEEAVMSSEDPASAFTNILIEVANDAIPKTSTIHKDCQEQEMGVPQGSILSPVLFSLKINNIVKSVTKGTDASLFVDDFALCVKGKSLHRQILADFPGFRQIFTDGSKSEDGRVGAAAVMDGRVFTRRLADVDGVEHCFVLSQQKDVQHYQMWKVELELEYASCFACEAIGKQSSSSTLMLGVGSWSAILADTEKVIITEKGDTVTPQIPTIPMTNTE
nr:hypothetical protein BaRGS_022335 [Batillaria attramentaria]